MSDQFNLQRFVQAQDAVYDRVLAELRSGRKASHWMWFIFPQIAGLGSSSTSRQYAIASLDEARAYLDHPVLGSRLRECVRLVLSHERLSTHDIFGSPDDLKLHSSLTLFAQAAPQEPLFGQALDRHFGGSLDPHTTSRL